MSPLKLYSIFPNSTDATSFYRGVGPLARMKNITIGTSPEVNWGALALTDALFLQRPYTIAATKTILMAKRMARPIWVDYDDDLYAVPPSNRTAALYRSKDTQNIITDAIAKAELVTVSTQALAEKFGSMLEAMKGQSAEPHLILDPTKIHIVPNAYDERLAQPLSGEWRRKRHQRKLVAWRGSCTHDDDLWCFAKEIRASVSAHTDWTWAFVGDPFWLLIDDLKRIPNTRDTTVIQIPSMDPIEYFSFMRETAPALIIVPLRDCEFNRAKSNIAWLEGIHAGAVTLAPDWPEWRRPGVINYFGQEDFGKKLESFVRGEIDGAKLWEEGATYVKEHMTLGRQNILRSELVERYLRV